MSLSTSPYKGTRDFYPEDMALRRYIDAVWTKVVESYGYERYDAPWIEPTELYSAKTGEEIVSEQSYRFEDRGGRDVMIRPEMTPSVSRMVAARRQELAYPVRWYSVADYMRYERPQRGRLRQFGQLNVDIFGVSTVDAELELIMIAQQIMKEFGATNEMYEIRINSRKLVSIIFADYLKLDGAQSQQLRKLLDKKDKMPHDRFVESADAVINNSETLERLMHLLESKSMADLPEEILSSSAVREIQILFTLLADNNMHNAKFDMTLMRGLDYYTDLVFEVFDLHPENNRAMFGGGRYDGLVGLFGVDEVPTAGFAIGDATLENFLQSHELLPELSTQTDIYLVVIGDFLRQAQGVANILREEGVNVEVDITGRKPEKQLKTADKKGIQNILFVGENEIETEIFTLRDMATREEEQLSLERIITKLKAQ